MNVVLDLAEAFHDLLVGPTFDRTPEIDSDDLSQHPGVNAFIIVRGKCHISFSSSTGNVPRYILSY
jgi:hypothetical protein